MVDSPGLRSGLSERAHRFSVCMAEAGYPKTVVDCLVHPGMLLYQPNATTVEEVRMVHRASLPAGCPVEERFEDYLPAWQERNWWTVLTDA